MGMNNEETKVSVGLGYTLNLGNFQSLRIDLSITDNKRDGENTNEAFERVYAFVEDSLQRRSERPLRRSRISNGRSQGEVCLAKSLQ